MKLAAFLKIIRWKNLLLLVYTQLIIKLILFKSFTIESQLSTAQFVTFVLALLFITAAGYIINDIYDVKSDLINKPSKVIVSKIISKENAQRWYLITNTFGIVFGIIVSFSVQKPGYSFIFMGASLLLYYYSKILKSMPLIGNSIVSLLIGSSILILYIFDIDKTVNTPEQDLVKQLIFVLSFFAFSLNIIREIVKDIEDINGDYILKMNTLPIFIGRKRAKHIASFLCLVPLSLLLFIVIRYVTEYKFIAIYLILFTVLPLLYVALKLTTVKTKKEIHNISTILKLIMFFGVNTLIIFTQN